MGIVASFYMIPTTYTCTPVTESSTYDDFVIASSWEYFIQYACYVP